MKSASSGMTLEKGGPTPRHVAVSQHRRCAEAASSPTALLRARMVAMARARAALTEKRWKREEPGSPRPKH